MTLLRNDGGRLRCEFNGMTYDFHEGEQREVDDQMALALQFRFAHVGLHIVEPGSEPVPEPGPVAEPVVEPGPAPAPKSKKR